MGCKKLSFYITKIKNDQFLDYGLVLHSADNDLIVVNNTKNRIPIDINRSGVSYVVRNELAILPAVPKVVITENPIGPQLQAPADAPTIVPVILGPIFLTFLTNFILKIFMETTIPAKTAMIKINEKLNTVSL